MMRKAGVQSDCRQVSQVGSQAAREPHGNAHVAPRSVREGADKEGCKALSLDIQVCKVAATHKSWAMSTQVQILPAQPCLMDYCT